MAKKPPQTHWYVDASGLSARARSQIQRDVTKAYGAGAGRSAVLPNQWVGTGLAGQKKATELSRSLKGARVYSSHNGPSTDYSTIWARLGHGLVSLIWKGRK